MTPLELGSTAQHWFNVVFIWIGFGTVAGLLARMLIPARHVGGATAIVTLGIVGTVIGPLALGWLLKGRLNNPIGPLGLLASIGGAFVLLVIYYLVARPAAPGADTEEP